MKAKYVIIPAVSSLLLSACTLPFVNQAAKTITQSAEETAAKQEILKNCTYDKSICAYMVAQINAFQTGVTMASAVTGAKNNSDIKTVTKMDGQGNMQSTSYKGDKETADMIVRNKVTYLKDYTDNTWLKMTASDDTQASSPSFNIPQSAADLTEQLKSDNNQMVYTKIGTEACGQYTCEIFEFYDNKDDQSYKNKIWIDTTEHFSRKMEMSLSDGGTTIITYSYGPVSITEPSPVKEFTMPSAPTGNGIPSQQDIQNMMQQLPQNSEE